MVPLIFQDYAQDIAERVAVMRPKAVLETAAGSGVVARSLGAKLHVLLHLITPAGHREKEPERHDARVEC